MNNIDIQFIQMSTSKSLEKHILNKLEKIFKFYQKLTEVNVYIKHENTSENKGKVCEIELRQPSLHLFASANENDYQLAVNKTVDQIKKQLEKYKN